MKRHWAIAALVMPLLFFALAILKAKRHLVEGETYRFAIGGYDPRDMLRGHYLRFRVTYDWEEDRGHCEVDASEDCCLCLMRSGDSPPGVVYATCDEARSQCDGSLLASERDDMNRYYIPEEKAAEAEAFLRLGQSEANAFIIVSITPDGRAQLVDLEIDGQSLETLLSQ